MKFAGWMVSGNYEIEKDVVEDTVSQRVKRAN